MALMNRKLFRIIPLVGGILVFLSAFAHGFLGWAQLSDELASTNAGPALISGIKAGWFLGSFAMIAFGLIIIVLTTRLLRGAEVSITPIVVIGLTYFAFGLWAYLSNDYRPHFLGFIVPGLMILSIVKR